MDDNKDTNKNLFSQRYPRQCGKTQTNFNYLLKYLELGREPTPEEFKIDFVLIDINHLLKDK